MTTKTFTVTNTGSIEVYYDIDWKELTNTIKYNELVMTLTCTGNGCKTITNKVIGNGNQSIIQNISIPANTTHTYTMTVTFIETSSPQDYNQGQRFNGVININETNKWYQYCTDSSTDLKCKIVANNTTNNSFSSDDVTSTYVTSATGMDFSQVNSPANGQGLYLDEKYGDGTNAYFRGGTYCAYDNYLSENEFGEKCTLANGTWDSTTIHCSLDDSRSDCESKGFQYYELNNNLTFGGYAWKIIRIDDDGNIRLLFNGDTPMSRGNMARVTTVPFNSKAIGDNRSVGYMYGTINSYSPIPSIGTKDVDKTDINPSTSYCYSKNLVINSSTGFMSLDSPICAPFSNTYADGTYYTLWNANPSASTSSIAYKISSYVSSTSCTQIKVLAKANNQNNEFDNNENSTIKLALENWYNTNLSANSSKISDAGYCNDRSIQSGTGIGNNETYYKSIYARMTSPSFICENSERDLFTLSGSAKGNKMQTYPVGLINSDELTYGGMIYSGTAIGSFHSYLQSGSYYWTMSPYALLNINGTAEIIMSGSLGVYYDIRVSTYGSIRPVIALKPETLYVSGSGSMNDPYVVN